MEQRHQDGLCSNRNDISEIPTIMSHCRRLKNVLRKSLRKSRNMIKIDGTRLSKSLNLPASRLSSMLLECRGGVDSLNNQAEAEAIYGFTSSYDLDRLFALDEQTPVAQQIVQAVNICRQLPEFEVSEEMVEAERLLLFSTLRRRKQFVEPMPLALVCVPRAQKHSRRYYIDNMQLPVKANPSQDIFFNYFYIVTFMCGGVICSTQSVECRNHMVIFADCGIEFNCLDEDVDGNLLTVHGDIFMLRLRKISTLSLEPTKPIVKLPNDKNSSGGSSSNDDIVSRFRLHASFTLHARNFVPYEYVECETRRSNTICLRAAKQCTLTLTPHTKSTNLAGDIQIYVRAEARFAKRTYSGLLNMQEPLVRHHWNQRWCTLEGLQLSVWRDVNDIKEKPLLCIDLYHNSVKQLPLPLLESPRELCARARSFCLPCVVSVANAEPDSIVPVFFAAETQTDLTLWLEHLNAVLQFIANWMI